MYVWFFLHNSVSLWSPTDDIPVCSVLLVFFCGSVLQFCLCFCLFVAIPKLILWHIWVIFCFTLVVSYLLSHIWDTSCLILIILQDLIAIVWLSSNFCIRMRLLCVIWSFIWPSDLFYIYVVKWYTSMAVLCLFPGYRSRIRVQVPNLGGPAQQ